MRAGPAGVEALGASGASGRPRLMAVLLSAPAELGLAAAMAATWLLGRDLSGFGAGAAGAGVGAVAAGADPPPEGAGDRILGRTRLWAALLPAAAWVLSV